MAENSNTSNGHTSGTCGTTTSGMCMHQLLFNVGLTTVLPGKKSQSRSWWQPGSKSHPASKIVLYMLHTVRHPERFCAAAKNVKYTEVHKKQPADSLRWLLAVQGLHT